MNENNKCTCTISIRTTVDKLWEAFTTPEITKKFWFGYQFDATWAVSSRWNLKAPDGKVHAAGEIVEVDRLHKIIITWRDEIRPELTAEGYSYCVIVFEPEGDTTKLTITHSIESTQNQSKLIALVATSWLKVVSNLKTFLETGDAVSKL
jgi:uncharacterized protein YndB with AHSA1/START domain